MDGKDFIEIARRFCASESEAERRTAISRAYYALYNHLKSRFQSLGILVSKGPDGHHQMYRYLHNSGVEEAEIIAPDLNSLRTIRNDADYDLAARGFDKLTCQLNVKKAEIFLDKFDDLDVKALARGIKAYMSKIG